MLREAEAGSVLARPNAWITSIRIRTRTYLNRNQMSREATAARATGPGHPSLVNKESRIVQGMKNQDRKTTTDCLRTRRSASRHNRRYGATPVTASAVAGVRISHPDRPIYPDLGISKIQLASYYEQVGDWMLPHLAGRPLTLVHCPAGLAAPCIYLRHAKAWGPKALQRVRIQEKRKVGEYLVANSVEAIVSLAQMGVVEVHTWNSTADDIERPNRLVWDLDPGASVTWAQIVTAARLVREVLRTLGLTSWVKTTGGRGLHVVVPVTPARVVVECLEFSRHVSDAIVRADPRLYTTKFAKLGRERKILIDYLRNNRTNTSICAFSPRARAGATVSMPLAWRDLTTPPQRWTLITVPRRLQRMRSDPWAEYWTTAQEIPEASFAAVKILPS